MAEAAEADAEAEAEEEAGEGLVLALAVGEGDAAEDGLEATAAAAAAGAGAGAGASIGAADGLAIEDIRRNPIATAPQRSALQYNLCSTHKKREESRIRSNQVLLLRFSDLQQRRHHYYRDCTTIASTDTKRWLKGGCLCAVAVCGAAVYSSCFSKNAAILRPRSVHHFAGRCVLTWITTA